MSRYIASSTFLFVALSASNASAVCAPDPVADFGAIPVSNERSYSLSEIGGCKNLVCWMDNVANTAYANSTLVIDQLCELNQTLTIPPRMVLAGVGMDGEGVLSFQGLAYGQPALQVTPGANSAGVTIRDLRIVGDNPKRGRGIVLDSAHQVNIERVRISGFSMGIYGRESYSTVVDKSNLHGNDFHIYLDFTANTWRITSNVLNQAGRWGIYQSAANNGTHHSNSVMILGNRLESNNLGGIRVAAAGTIVQNNEFEGNGGAGNVAIRVDAPAIDTRILGNFYSGDCPIDGGVGTQTAFDVFYFAACP